MNISHINHVSASLPSQASAESAKPTDGNSFAQLIAEKLGEANLQQQQADQNIQQLMSGEADSVQDVVLSVAKADLSFRMLVEIRNKLIESYQEIMRMQV
ncbi:MAG: flagellar hook-basal body complex protein FliE [Pirellulaceae bacterium]